MSKLCCVFCGCVFVPGKMNRKGFCSLECWRKYEKLNSSHNCLGVARQNGNKNKIYRYKKVKVDRRVNRMVKRNLGEVLDEINGEAVWEDHCKSKISYNPNLTNATHQKLEALLKQIKSFRSMNGLF